MASPPRKFAKWDYSDPRRSTKLRFDDLSEAALVNIARHLSTKPRSPDWKKFIALEDVSSALRLNGSMHHVMRSSISDLELSLRGSSVSEGLAHGFILMILGDKLRRLDLTAKSFPSALVPHCTGLRQLRLTVRSFRNPASVLLRERGHALEELELLKSDITQEDVSDLSCCSSLQRLKLIFSELKAPLAAVWRGARSSLLHLEMNVWGNDVALWELPALAKECRRLRTLSFRGVWDLPHQYELFDLFGPFTSSLRLIELDSGICLSKEQINGILMSCPNVSLDLRTLGMDQSGIEAMGASAVHLRIDNDAVGNLKKIGDSCPNIRSCEFRLDAGTSKDFLSFFETEKLQLEHVSVFVLSKNEPTSNDILLALAEKVSGLQELSYSGPLPPVDAWEQLARANPRLRTVRLNVPFAPPCLRMHDLDRHCRVDWKPYVSPLLAHAAMEEIDFSCAPAHSSSVGPKTEGIFAQKCVDTCLSARSKLITITLCGYQYL